GRGVSCDVAGTGNGGTGADGSGAIDEGATTGNEPNKKLISASMSAGVLKRCSGFFVIKRRTMLTSAGGTSGRSDCRGSASFSRFRIRISNGVLPRKGALPLRAKYIVQPRL